MRNGKSGFVEADAMPMNGLEPTVRSSAARPAVSIRGRIPARAPLGLAARTAGNARVNVRASGSNIGAITQRMVSAINARIVEVLSQDASEVEREQARVEVALLVKLHRGFEMQTQSAQEDVVLCDSLLEFADAVPAILADLEAGGTRRLRRLLEYNRELLSQLCAFGGTAAGFKPRIEQARAWIACDDASKFDPAAREAVALYVHLSGELERHCPRARGNLFDELARP